MKNVLTLLSCIVTCVIPNTHAQVMPTRYDSSNVNIGISNLYLLKGQQLYIPERISKNDYWKFYKSYIDEEVYNPARNSENSSYATLANKYYEVLDVIERKEVHDDEANAHISRFLKLKEKQSGETLYFHATSTVFSSFFPFIIVGYYEKARQNWINKVIVLPDGMRTNYNDKLTNKPFPVITGEKWTCKDLIIAPATPEVENIDSYILVMVLKNEQGNEIAASYDFLTEPLPEERVKRYYPLVTALKYARKFGTAHWKGILSRTPAIGMTPEMTRLMLGKPQEEAINNNNGKNILTQVYWDYILQFENSRLKSITKTQDDY
jgi:hypothetical protein